MRRVHVSMSALGLFVALLVAGHPGVAVAQTQFVPYFGKNNIHYDRFDWKSYETEHFTIWFYPEIEKHLERIAGYAESAYQQISADLKHDLAQRVPLILFKTSSEFQEQNVVPGAAQAATCRRLRVRCSWSCSRPTASSNSRTLRRAPHRRASAPLPNRFAFGC